jgi:hypothetical protein
VVFFFLEPRKVICPRIARILVLVDFPPIQHVAAPRRPFAAPDGDVLTSQHKLAIVSHDKHERTDVFASRIGRPNNSLALVANGHVACTIDAHDVRLVSFIDRHSRVGFASRAVM